MSLGGVCPDTGDQKSVIVSKQALVYCELNGLKINFYEPASFIRFGDGTHKSLGNISIPISTLAIRELNNNMDVVRIDVTLLIGLTSLDE